MSQNISAVYESQATYYNPVLKKWKEGHFRLHKNHLEFLIENKKDSEQFHLSLPLSTISGIEKRQSSFIYSAVVITVGSEKHWFASFSNRDTVYNLLELFWRGTLFAKTYKTPVSSPQNGSTPLAKELLKLLCDTENTLVNAANALVDQGRQLHDSEEAIEEINGDLTLAEKWIKNMNDLPSLINKIGSPSREQQMKNEAAQKRLKRYEITFLLSRNANEKLDNWEKGTVVISEELSLFNESDCKCLHIPGNQLIKIQVVSPWELQINYIAANKEESCHIMCPQLSALLKFVSSVATLREKLIYDQEENSVYGTPCSSTSSSMPESALSSPSPPIMVLPGIECPENESEMQFSQELLSDEEITEISKVLSNLQVLAADVGKEQKCQVEKINSLIEDIDKTALRIQANEKVVTKNSS